MHSFMVDYTDLYEFLRKEKYSEQLQNLPRDFIQQFSNYLKDARKKFSDHTLDFSEDVLREKKQYENAIALFKEMMLRRKKKILNLVFVAAETGIMKRDFADMLPFEKDLFERLILAVDDAEKELHHSMNGRPLENVNKMIIAKEDIEQFVDMAGEAIGPYKKGELINLDSEIADILISSNKAMKVDEN